MMTTVYASTADVFESPQRIGIVQNRRYHSHECSFTRDYSNISDDLLIVINKLVARSDVH